MPHIKVTHQGHSVFICVCGAAGLESLYNLTSMTPMSLRVDMRDKDEVAFAKYSKFELVKRNYKLIVGGYSGTAGDKPRPFPPRDLDNMVANGERQMSFFLSIVP